VAGFKDGARVVVAIATGCALVLAGAGAVTIANETSSSTGHPPNTRPSRTATVAAQSPLSGPFVGRIRIDDGRELYLRCAGTGKPTVVLESGIHDSSDTWTISATDAAPVFTEVAKYAHVCMYDRPGTIRYSSPPALTTRSTPVAMPRTLSGMASDLHALLDAAHIPGPYVLVGHSYGGMIVREFAQTYPRSSAGIVFVDAFGPNIAELFGSQWPAYAQTLNKPGTALDDKPGWETVDPDEAIHTVQRDGPLPRIPAVVISKTEPFAVSPSVPAAITDTLERAWPQVQDALVALEPDTPHVRATGSDHYVQLHDPDLVSSMIRLVLHRSEAKATLGID
jgi:pimeloyl-ACP methyl ester carboxylesterase